MSSSLNSLKETASSMQPRYRVWVEVYSTHEWYKVIREANALYGLHNWRCQPRTKRKLESNWAKQSIRVWFEVPDPGFATWVSVKHSVIARLEANK